MFTRSQLRHACYRAKNNAVSEKNKPIIDLIEPLLSEGQNWQNFSKVWDVYLDRDSNIRIIKPETDKNFIEKTIFKICAFDEVGKSLDSLTDREMNVFNQVQPLLLDGIMTWCNYGTVWGINVSLETNLVSTILYNVKSSQIEVTQEMIEASKKDADGSAYTAANEIKPVTMEMKPMTEKQKKAFDEFLAKKIKE